MAYFDKYGVEFSDDKKTIVKCPKDFHGTYVIPNGVISVGNWAFRDCINLKSIEIPDSVRFFGTSAFLNCSGLTSVHINSLSRWCLADFLGFDSNPLFKAHHLYLDKKEIVNLVIPHGMIGIKPVVFAGGTGLKSVTFPDGFMYINTSAFCDCKGLTKITLPNSVTHVGHGAFCGCSGIANIFLGDNITVIEDMSFCGCDSLVSVYIPESMETIGSYAFAGCSNLTSITIPDSISNIGYEPFRECNSLRSIKIYHGNSSPNYDLLDSLRWMLPNPWSAHIEEFSAPLIQCKHCGYASLPLDAKFCPECGGKV